MINVGQHRRIFERRLPKLERKEIEESHNEWWLGLGLGLYNQSSLENFKIYVWKGSHDIVAIKMSLSITFEGEDWRIRDNV